MPADPGIGVRSDPNVIRADLPCPHEGEDQNCDRGYGQEDGDKNHYVAVEAVTPSPAQGTQGDRAFPGNQNDECPASNAMNFK